MAITNRALRVPHNVPESPLFSLHTRHLVPYRYMVEN